MSKLRIRKRLDPAEAVQAILDACDDLEWYLSPMAKRTECSSCGLRRAENQAAWQTQGWVRSIRTRAGRIEATLKYTGGEQ